MRGSADRIRRVSAVQRDSSPTHVVKRIFVGRSMASGRMEHTLLPKVLALPIFASDALSSVAYWVEASLVILVGASANVRGLILPHQPRGRRGHGRRRHVVPPGRAGLPDLGGFVRREQGEPRHDLRAHRRRRAAGRLRPHRRRVGVVGHPGDLVGHGRPAQPGPGEHLHRVRDPDHGREPPGRARVGVRLRRADLRVHLRDVRVDRRRPRPLPRLVPAGDRRPGPRPGRNRRRRRPLRDPPLVRVGVVGPHGNRGDLERGERVPAPAGSQRVADARASSA